MLNAAEKNFLFQVRFGGAGDAGPDFVVLTL